MLLDRYVEAVNALLSSALENQRDNLDKAADLVLDTLKQDGNVHVYDTGHIINSELINRAGGLAILKPLRYTFTVDDPVRGDVKPPMLEGLGKFVLDNSKVNKGDTLIIGSVSGKTPFVVDLALAAKEMGVHLIVVTSIAYSSQLQSDHSSGKRLFEIGDVVIDNNAPKGDAMLEVEGLENKFGPASGLSSAYLGWCLSAIIVEKMLAVGYTPTVFKSINFPDGKENYDRMCQAYADTGK